MARNTKKMICHDCGQVFNRKPQNGDKQVCWNCKSLRVGLVTDEKVPPPQPTVTPPPPVQIPKPVKSPLSGITPDMLLKAKAGLKHVVKPPVVLPGNANSVIPRGVRMLAHLVQNPIVTGNGLRLAALWRPRNSRDEYLAFTSVASVDLTAPLRNIAMGIPDPDNAHQHANGRYWNNGHEMPNYKKRRGPHPLVGIAYREYGWKRPIHPNAAWFDDDRGIRSLYSRDDNRAVNSFLNNLRQGRIFSERLLIAETGEVFYTPDHYITFFRYHPGTRAWYQYHSAAGAGGPRWDESFYEEPR